MKNRSVNYAINKPAFTEQARLHSVSISHKVEEKLLGCLDLSQQRRRIFDS